MCSLLQIWELFLFSGLEDQVFFFFFFFPFLSSSFSSFSSLFSLKFPNPSGQLKVSGKQMLNTPTNVPLKDHDLGLNVSCNTRNGFAVLVGDKAKVFFFFFLCFFDDSFSFSFSSWCVGTNKRCFL